MACPTCGGRAVAYWVDGEPGLVWQTPLATQILWARREATQALNQARHRGWKDIEVALQDALAALDAADEGVRAQSGTQEAVG
jgi:hypothetical protein